MSNFSQKIKHELRALIPVTVFFFFAFQLLALTDALILKQYGIRISVFMSATVAALVVAKIVIITDHIAAVNRFPRKPLIYNVVWKTIIYFLAWLVLRYTEHFIHFYRVTGNTAEANSRLLGEIVWPHFWGVQLWMLVLLLVFCTFRELVRVLGREQLIDIFFKHPPRPDIKD